MHIEWTNLIFIIITLVLVLLYLCICNRANKRMYIEITELERHKIESIEDNQLKYYQEYKEYSEELESTLKFVIFRNYLLMTIIVAVMGVGLTVNLFLLVSLYN